MGLPCDCRVSLPSFVGVFLGVFLGRHIWQSHGMYGVEIGERGGGFLSFAFVRSSSRQVGCSEGVVTPRKARGPGGFGWGGECADAFP